MKSLVICCLLIFFTQPCFTQTRVILDADIDSDVDDVAALAMLHKMATDNQVELLGVIVTSDDPYAPVCASTINRYYGRKKIPVGFKKNQPVLINHSRYTKKISEEFPAGLKSYQECQDAVALYRKLLSNSPDGSVTIITIGHLTSLQDLLQSCRDQYSSLNGKDLAIRKVSKWICMGGMFPSGKEANFYRPDPQSTVYCLKEWKKPLIFCGWEIGKGIVTGGPELKTALPPKSPVYRAFELYNNFAGRPSWDQASILLLNADYSKYFDLITGGYCQVDPDGSNNWIAGATSNQCYVSFKSGAIGKEIAAAINNMLIK